MQLMLRGTLLSLSVSLLVACASPSGQLQRDTVSRLPSRETPGVNLAGVSQSPELLDPRVPDEEIMPEATTVYRGTGNFINRQAAASGDPVREVNGEVTLNFEAADIRDVVKIIFDTLQENYIIDPQVQGQVTVQTSRPLPRSALLPTLETLLRSSNAALVRSGGIFEVVPVSQAVTGNTIPRLSNAQLGPGYSVRIFPLRYISATEMETILQPFAPEGGILLVDPIRNLIILAGTELELANLQETIGIFDVNWLQGMSVGMYILENVEAQTLVTELEGILGLGGESPMAGMFRFVPVERLNAVIAITPQPEFLEQASAWIERLDGSAGERLYIYEVQNGDAEYIASILSEIFDATTSAPAAPSDGGRVAPGRTPGQISAGGLGGSAQFLNVPEGSDIAFPMVGEGSASGHLGEGYINFVDSAFQVQETDPAAMGAPSQPVRLGPASRGTALANAGSIAGGATSEVRIIADVENNALLIWSNTPTYNKIVRALRRLDITPRQVLVEVTIAEVSLTGVLRYGLQWFFTNSVSDEYQGTGSLNLNTDVPVSGADGILSAVDRTFSYVISKDGIVRALLETLARESKVRILSSPQIMVIDNQDAEIRVGDQQPVRSSTTVTTGGNTTESISFKDTGVFLQVTPQVNSSGLVSMSIVQEVIDVGGIDAATGQRSFFERSLSSKVAVQSGETIVLGGLISEERRDEQEGVPFLYKVPVIGPLFGTNSEDVNRTELLVLITPRVVQNTQEAVQITRELRQRMQSLDPFVDADLIESLDPWWERLPAPLNPAEPAVDVPGQ